MAHAAPYPPFTLPNRELAITVGVLPDGIDAVGHVVYLGDEPPAATQLSTARAAQLGFDASLGSTLVLVSVEGPLTVLVGAGERAQADARVLRDAAAHFARAIPKQERLGFVLPASAAVSAEEIATAVVEGAALARYVYRIGEDGPDAKLSALALVCEAEVAEEVRAGVTRGELLVKATKLARDLAGTPGGILTATALGKLAAEIGPEAGLEVQVFGEEELVELGCGGLLGINLGSEEPPAMIKLTYRPAGEPTGKLALVGKGIMYDAGGLALKPGDEVHAVMKNDMAGAGAILAAMTVLRDLGCRAQVTGWLMCTDNMPSGSALRLGDIVVMRGGKTVEVINTDAEGRMVMADAFVLAQEEPVDAMIDVATLTGAAMRTLGTDIAAVLGNNTELLDLVKGAAERVDEPVWELPLANQYRGELNSVIADLRNMGGANAGTITAALFLQEFVDGTPWVHIDIAGTAYLNSPNKWRNKGTTGFGTRLLVDVAMNYRA